METIPLMVAVDEWLELKYGGPFSPYTRDATREAAERLFLYYNRRGLPGNTNNLNWLIGQEPMGEVQKINIKAWERCNTYIFR